MCVGNHLISEVPTMLLSFAGKQRFLHETGGFSQVPTAIIPRPRTPSPCSCCSWTHAFYPCLSHGMGERLLAGDLGSAWEYLGWLMIIWLVVWNFYFPIHWEQSSQLTNIFQRGSNHQPVIVGWFSLPISLREIHVGTIPRTPPPQAAPCCWWFSWSVWCSGAWIFSCSLAEVFCGISSRHHGCVNTKSWDDRQTMTWMMTGGTFMTWDTSKGKLTFGAVACIHLQRASLCWTPMLWDPWYSNLAKISNLYLNVLLKCWISLSDLIGGWQTDFDNKKLQQPAISIPPRNFNTSYFAKGSLITSQRQIAKHYISTWLLLDVSLVVLDYFTAVHTWIEDTMLRGNMEWWRSWSRHQWKGWKMCVETLASVFEKKGMENVTCDVCDERNIPSLKTSWPPFLSFPIASQDSFADLTFSRLARILRISRLVRLVKCLVLKTSGGLRGKSRDGL